VIGLLVVGPSNYDHDNRNNEVSLPGGSHTTFSLISSFSFLNNATLYDPGPLYNFLSHSKQDMNPCDEAY
jgi:hypothetical protein